jgi:hypothetical protein
MVNLIGPDLNVHGRKYKSDYGYYNIRCRFSTIIYLWSLFGSNIATRPRLSASTVHCYTFIIRKHSLQVSLNQNIHHFLFKLIYNFRNGISGVSCSGRCQG